MIAILDYGAGNTRSVQNALKKLNAQSIITQDPEIILKADKVIFPGVGEAASAMEQILNKNLDQLIKQLSQPFLGICLGQQLMCRESEERDTACLGVFDVAVKRFPAKDRVPHIGWNNLTHPKGLLFHGIDEKDDFYFVHSYYCEENPFAVAGCDYILPFSAAMEKDNFFAAQFHPEKSGAAGKKFLENFVKI